MKHGKRLKRKHKAFLSSQGHNYKSFLVVKDTSALVEFVNRETGKTLMFRYEN